MDYSSQNNTDKCNETNDKVMFDNGDINFEFLINSKLQNDNKTKYIINKRGFEEPEGYQKYLTENPDSDSNSEEEYDVSKRYKKQLAKNLSKSDIKGPDGFNKHLTQNSVTERDSEENISDDDEDISSELKDYTITSEQRWMLNTLKIKINFDIPPLHTYGSRKYLVRPKIKINDMKYRKGAFLKTEDDVIRRNFKEFCQLHNIPEIAIPFIIMKKMDFDSYERFHEFGKEFIQFLAKGLPTRPLKCVYQRFVIIYSEYKTGNFTEYENRKIMKYFKKFGSVHDTPEAIKKFNEFNRSLRCIYYHYLKLIDKKNGTGFGIGRQFDNLILIREVMKELKVNDVNHLKQYDYRLHFFKPISEKLRIAPFSLYVLWNYTIFVKLFIKERNSSRVMRTILEMMIDEEINDFRSVNLEEYRKRIEGSTNYFIGQIIGKIKKKSLQLHWIKDVIDKLKYMRRWMIRINNSHIPTIDLKNLHVD